MRFYRYDGFIKNENWMQKNKDSVKIRRGIKALTLKVDDFNSANSDKGFFFIKDASESDFSISIGVIWNCDEKSRDYIDLLLCEIGLEVEELLYKEITFLNIRDMLRGSERYDYIRDADEIFERYSLSLLVHRSYVSYSEKIIDGLHKEKIYKKAEGLPVEETLLQELDRIFTGKKHNKIYGHPVHYFVRSDDKDIQNAVYDILLEALYAVGRIMNKRYGIIDVKQDYHYGKAIYEELFNCNSGGAIVLRYNYNFDEEDDYAKGERELIEDICDMIKKYRSKVLTILSLPCECTKTKEVFYENLGDTSFVDIFEDYAKDENAKKYLKSLAKRYEIRTDKKLFDIMEKDKVYYASELREIFENWYDKKLKNTIFPQYKEIASVKKKIIKKKPKGSAYQELMEMVGLDEAKRIINQAIDFYKAQKVFADKGMKQEKVSMHMVFTGNPGTAKTTVARLFSEIMKENNILTRGSIVEVGRSDLVGKYVGWTAPTIKKKFEAAKGGVLFIDEAYSLVDDRDGSYGDEAINTIVQEMENHRQEVIVIFAGYPDKMEKFLQKNPGLRSRIAFHVPFSDYNSDELCEIARIISSKDNYKIETDAYEIIKRICDVARLDNDFGNGRFVRNLLEKAKMKQAGRLLSLDYDKIKKEDVVTICAEDIEPLTERKKEKVKLGFCMDT